MKNYFKNNIRVDVIFDILSWQVITHKDLKNREDYFLIGGSYVGRNWEKRGISSLDDYIFCGILIEKKPTDRKSFDYQFVNIKKRVIRIKKCEKEKKINGEYRK